MAYDPVAAAAGARLISLDTVGSTNAEALEHARVGDRGPLWIAARIQTAGRGRRGNRFVSPAGNLYASLLLTDPSPAPRAAELSFVSALAVHDAIVEAAAALGPRLKIKWPNDLVCDGAKVVGILIEGEGAADRPLAVVIGIGVNCVSHPPDTPYPATDLAEAGALVTPDSMLRALIDAMRRRLAQWDRGEGFAAIRRAWLTRAVGLGEVAVVRLQEREIEGVIETLDDDGRLVLRLRDGSTQHITAGEVFPMVATARTPP